MTGIHQALTSSGGNTIFSIFQGSTVASSLVTTTATLTSAAIGSGGSHLVIGLTQKTISNGVRPSGLTVNGVSATFVTQSVGGIQPTSSFWIIAVPGGTTANLVASIASSSFTTAEFHVWTVYNLVSPTPTGSGGDFLNGAGTVTVTLTPTLTNSIMFGCGMSSITTGNATWTILTELSDANNSNTYTAASLENVTPGSQSVNLTLSGANERCMAAAVWQQ